MYLHNQSLEQIPHWVQMVMAGEATPILSGAIPAFKMDQRWSTLGNTVLQTHGSNQGLHHGDG